MDEQKQILFLQKQVEALERERAAALNALDLTASLGSFESSYSQRADNLPILREICRRARVMAAFRAASVYLIDQETQDLGLRFHDAPEYAESLDREVDALILDQSFVFAAQSGRPCFFLSSDKKGALLLHALSTPNRVRGMFVGLLDQDKNDILDTTRILFTVVMLAGAHALESFELNRRFQEHRRELELAVERRTAQLREANAQMTAILDNIQVGVLLVDAQNHVIEDLNPAGLRMMGATRAQVVGKECHLFLCPAQKGCCPITDTGQEVDNSERTLLTLEGKSIPILKTVSGLMLGGRPHLLETFLDISEQKKLTQLKEDIEHITRHDLKSPLSGIIGAPDILLEVGPLNEEQRQLAKGIKDSGLKMLRMINMSLDLYKMEIGAYDYRPVEVDLAAVLRGALKDLEGLARYKRLTMDITIDGRAMGPTDSFRVKGEELLYYSLLANLIKNGIEASPRGSPFSVSLESGRVVGVTVQNQGEVPEAMRERFFEKYATSGKKGGTGLGTYSAMLIARTMGGSVTMRTSESEGVTVSVRLPQ